METVLGEEFFEFRIVAGGVLEEHLVFLSFVVSVLEVIGDSIELLEAVGIYFSLEVEALYEGFQVFSH